MNSSKKFLAFAFASAAIIASVILVTPAVKTLAKNYIDDHKYTYLNGNYVDVTNFASSYTEVYTGAELNGTEEATTPTTPTKPTKAATAASSGSKKSSRSSSSATTEITLPAGVTTADGKPMVMFTSTDGSNTLMTGAVGLIPSGAKLQAIEASATSQTYSVAKAILEIWKPDATILKVYDFNVFSKQATMIKTLDGKVCMSLPIPDGLTVPEGMVLYVYKFNDDGSVTVCETLIDQGRIVWGTDSFGTFAFAVEKPAVTKKK